MKTGYKICKAHTPRQPSHIIADMELQPVNVSNQITGYSTEILVNCLMVGMTTGGILQSVATVAV